MAYQQRQLELKSGTIRHVVQELYQTGRMISLLPAIREARGGNRRSVQEDVVKEGRLSHDSHRILQQVYTNLRAYVRVFEIYFVMDGFDPEKGEVPFFIMYDDLIIGRTHIDGATAEPQKSEYAEHEEIRRQLAWFRQNAPTFSYETRLNTIPALISPLLQNCDNTQFVSKLQGAGPARGLWITSLTCRPPRYCQWFPV